MKYASNCINMTDTRSALNVEWHREWPWF